MSYPGFSTTPLNIGQIRKTLKSLAETQARNIQNFAVDTKVIEQENVKIRSALGDLLKLTSKPIQTNAGKNTYALEPSNKFSNPTFEARYLIDLAQAAQHSP